jgi:formamidopyrimidine-DNA glycosylase
LPELPDVVVYLEALDARITGRVIRNIRNASPFLLRTFDPPLEAALGKKVILVRRLGKRLVLGLEPDFFLVLHLMIAGRLHWKEEPGARIQAKIGLAAFDFENGTLLLTEAGTKKRASLHVVAGESDLKALDPGGIEVLGSTVQEVGQALARESHTLKRALTDPRLFSGIGNAYSDEILHRARLSPLANSRKLSGEEIHRLHQAVQAIMSEALSRLRREAGGQFPEGVTAFRPWMAVHGRFGKACPTCGAPVQRIVYSENETNYCPGCQTGGTILADRSLSRLLKDDWPRTLEELEGRGS